MPNNKIYVVMGDCGYPERAFKNKNNAMKYAEHHGLLEWHMRETDNCHDGVYELELWD